MPADFPPPLPAFEYVVATTGMSKGLSQTEGPQVLSRGSLRFGSAQAGVQWKNLSSPSADGEGSLFWAVSSNSGPLQLNAGIAWKFQTGAARGTDSRALELTAAASRKFGSVTLKANAIYSPDDLGSATQSLFVEAGPALKLGKGWAVSAAVGQRYRHGASGYSSLNFGIARTLGSAQFDLRVYATDKADLGPAYRRRLVGSLKMAF